MEKEKNIMHMHYELQDISYPTEEEFFIMKMQIRKIKSDLLNIIFSFLNEKKKLKTKNKLY